jgi:hypothetical protein
MMRSPLRRLPAGYARWPTLALLLALTLWLGTQAGGDRRLYSRNVSPRGLLSLERAGDLERAQKIMAFWDRWVGRQNVIESLDIRLIALYLLCYSAMLALACVIAADRLDSIGRLIVAEFPDGRRKRLFTHLKGTVVRLGDMLSWAQWLVVVVGLSEKLLLIGMLNPDSPPTTARVRLVGALTFVQILLRLLGVFYALCGASGYLLRYFPKPRLLSGGEPLSPAPAGPLSQDN